MVEIARVPANTDIYISYYPSIQAPTISLENKHRLLTRNSFNTILRPPVLGSHGNKKRKGQRRWLRKEDRFGKESPEMPLEEADFLTESGSS